MNTEKSGPNYEYPKRKKKKIEKEAAKIRFVHERNDMSSNWGFSLGRGEKDITGIG